MGHADESMAAIYRQTIDWSRLGAVAEVVRERVLPDFSPPGEGEKTEPGQIRERQRERSRQSG
ncbi:hypothetical protein [Alienimonas sp. DA493]|uniref:hypothetical protein n=1 Tax=Alienimonas sp. DA493 TaxID=3373605 RepID=UPI0037543D88